ncbi:unnamed protein product, partial [Brachionus calyciflorus]
SCKVNARFERTINYCSDELNIINHEKNRFGPKWISIENYTYDKSSSLKIIESFIYKKSDTLNSEPFIGLISTYLGGGYVYELNSDHKTLSEDLNFLNKNSWIDRNTRAIFIEFALYNPNIQLFSHCIILFEILPTGNMVKSYVLNPLNLFDFSTGLFSFEVISSIIYMIFVIFLFLKQLVELKREKCAYFKKFWTYIDLSIIAFSWAAFSIYIYRIYESDKIFEQIKTLNKTNNFINLQILAYFNEVLSFCLAFCAALGSLKFFKILNYNNRIRLLSETLKNGINEFLNFSLIFGIIWLAFIQVMYLNYHTLLSNYSSFIGAMETGFLIILGKYELKTMLIASPIFTTLIYVSYNLIIVFILLNIFFTLLNDSFNIVRNDAKNNKNEFEVGKYFKEIFNGILRRREKVYRSNISNIHADSYVESINSVDLNLAKNINKIERKINNLLLNHLCALSVTKKRDGNEKENIPPKTLKPCKCGSITHRRVSYSKCILNPINKTQHLTNSSQLPLQQHLITNIRQSQDQNQIILEHNTGVYQRMPLSVRKFENIHQNMLAIDPLNYPNLLQNHCIPNIFTNVDYQYPNQSNNIRSNMISGSSILDTNVIDQQTNQFQIQQTAYSLNIPINNQNIPETDNGNYSNSNVINNNSHLTLRDKNTNIISLNDLFDDSENENMNIEPIQTALVYQQNVRRKETSCACGSTSHKRKTYHSCPLNPYQVTTI